MATATSNGSVRVVSNSLPPFVSHTWKVYRRTGEDDGPGEWPGAGLVAGAEGDVVPAVGPGPSEAARPPAHAAATRPTRTSAEPNLLKPVRRFITFPLPKMDSAPHGRSVPKR